MKIKPAVRFVFQTLPVLAIVLTACNGHGTPTVIPLLGATITPTLPGGQFPDTPGPTPPTDTPVPTATTAPPTATVQPFAKNWSLDLIYDKTTSDERFEYDESLHGTATFSLDSNGLISGDGSGAYTQGLKSKIPTVDCGFPLSSPTSFKITGGPQDQNGITLFHMSIAVTFQPRLSTSINCGSKAAGINITIPVTGPGDILTQRAAGFPWNDYLINPVLGLYSELIPGEGIDWKKTGGGELTIRIKATQ